MTQPVPLPGAPVPVSSVERVRTAYVRRHETDYVFDFWSALGWTLLTCGVYGFYVVYQLTRRSRDHNVRRLELLEAANAVAWERAQAAGLADELRPSFERIAGSLGELRRLTGEFRDPVVWTVLSIFFSGIAQVILFIFLDQDLVKHDYHEGAVENELSFVFGRLGTPVLAPDPGRLHAAHNYAGRVIAYVFSCSFYYLWWLYNMMDDLNRHFAQNWQWEDSLASAVQPAA